MSNAIQEGRQVTGGSLDIADELERAQNHQEAARERRRQPVRIQHAPRQNK